MNPLGGIRRGRRNWTSPGPYQFFWLSTGYRSDEQFQIDGTPLAAVPEPAMLGLTCLGLLLLVGQKDLLCVPAITERTKKSRTGIKPIRRIISLNFSFQLAGLLRNSRKTVTVSSAPPEGGARHKSERIGQSREICAYLYFIAVVGGEFGENSQQSRADQGVGQRTWAYAPPRNLPSNPIHVTLKSRSRARCTSN